MTDNADVVVNRDEPIPALGAPGSGGASSDGGSKRDRMKASLSGSRLAERLQGAGTSFNDSGHSLQDRLFAKFVKLPSQCHLSKLLQQVIPLEDAQHVDVEPCTRASRHLNRPGFSLPLMTTNFRRFNARIGVVFVAQNQLLRLLTWRKPSHTLSFFVIYSFVCLNPYLLTIVPFVGILFSLLVPAYLVRHPPPPSSVSTISASQYSVSGPPLAPAKTLKPATEMSKDFFRNMRDLQNLMDDYSTIHDSLLAGIIPVTDFSNEPLSSTVFLFLFIATCVLFLASHLLPWRVIALFLGWAAIALGYPPIQDLVFSSIYKTHIQPVSTTARSWLDAWIETDIVMESTPETRQVEIFEIQRRKGSFGVPEWESWIFSPSAWEPMAPARIAGERIKGTRFFEDVQAPSGWIWEGKKWELDLRSTEWVEERLIGGVEVEVEGERWVSDLAAVGSEASGVGGTQGRRGEWRRRRWVRMVRRKAKG
ncbi:hypothetical protein MMC13_007933 [Lambiella insularis]|nr:hypothetical protein [Lambiella insularis]